MIEKLGGRDQCHEKFGRKINTKTEINSLRKSMSVFQKKNSGRWIIHKTQKMPKERMTDRTAAF